MEEADRQKQDVDEKLVQCLARETRVIDDLQKLKVGKESFLVYLENPRYMSFPEVIR